MRRFESGPRHHHPLCFTVAVNARSILLSIEGDAEGRKPLNRVEEAAQFLRAELANGPVPARELIERGKRDLGVNDVACNAHGKPPADSLGIPKLNFQVIRRTIATRAQNR